MKNIYIVLTLIFTVFISMSAMAGTCRISLVKESGNFTPSDRGPNGRVTYNVTIPYSDAYYPNPQTSTQPKPRVSLRNCITYQSAPANATIKSIRYNYTFKEAVLIADYQIMVTFYGVQNKFDKTSKWGSGHPRGSGIPLNGSGVTTVPAGQLLSSVDLEIRARVTNPAINVDCPAYIQRDQCRTRNTRLTNFTAMITWQQ